MEGHLGQGRYIVVDIGKTQAKVSLWSGDGRMLERQTRRNAPVEVDGIARLDCDGIGAFVVDTLGAFSAHPVEAIIPVAHGAGVAAIVDDTLAFPPLDYEAELPADLLAQYRALRPAFSETGSPALPAGLNLGAQLFWLDRLYPEAMAEATLVPWTQYWTWFLCGTLRTELTSMGCHTDLWSDDNSGYSSLAVDQGWTDHFAPLAQAADIAFDLRPELADATGLSPETDVIVGLHDSNAALLAARGFAEIEDNEATVLSTGTWFVAMRNASERIDIAALPEGRDCLMNIGAYGNPVPSARFMGGREIETLIELETQQVDIQSDQPALIAAVPGVIEAGAMVLPTFAPGCGPFPGLHGAWVNAPEDWHARRAAACLYAALMADVSLDLIGAKDRLLVEGRFAGAQVFVRALASLRPDMTIYSANAHNDVALGALRLVDPGLKPASILEAIEPLPHNLVSYRQTWREACENMSHQGATAQ